MTQKSQETQENSNNAGFEQTLAKQACPQIDAVVPPWPFEVTRHTDWIGLHSSGFVYTHHSSHGPHRRNKQDTSKTAVLTPDDIAGRLFCVPTQELMRLRSVLENSRGGSVLVTGYRGTGKTSLVNFAIEQLRQDNERRNASSDSKPLQAILPVRLNLSTSRDAHALVSMMLTALWRAVDTGVFELRERGPEVLQRVQHFYSQLGWAETSFEYNRNNPGSVTAVHARREYTLHEAQQDLCHCLELLRQNNVHVIFVLDELDKLTPRDPDRLAEPYLKKLIELQHIVADLKYLLTEAPAHYVFIAGKDVDDSWQEDQNKGEGLFESVFVQNIYIPSTFTANLSAALGPHTWIRKAWEEELTEPGNGSADKPEAGKTGWYEAVRKSALLTRSENDQGCEFTPEEVSAIVARWTNDLFHELLKELGIAKEAWSYNTGLLVLPHFSFNELERLLWRVVYRVLPPESSAANSTDNTDPLRRPENYGAAQDLGAERFLRHPWLYPLVQTMSDNGKRAKALQNLDFSVHKSDSGPPDPNVCVNRSLRIMSERSTRRVRYLLHYLTFKGRGIPRKVLREFYSMVQHRGVVGNKSDAWWKDRGDVQYVIYLPTVARQKLKFFSAIVSTLEANPQIFRVVDDKGCVATFHIIDYFLKFFRTGFRWSDVEYAGFMTYRKELLPSRELIESILRIFEDVLIERADRRRRLYTLLPQIKHDLEGLYLAFGPEQTELRFTEADFASELHRLKTIVELVDRTEPKERLESFRAQIRLADIHEDLGNHSEARMGYNKAIRWIQMDIDGIGRYQTKELMATSLSSLSNLVTAAVEIEQRLGYLCELEREFPEAIHHFACAILLHQGWQQLLARLAESNSPFVPKQKDTIGSVLFPPEDSYPLEFPAGGHLVTSNGHGDQGANKPKTKLDEALAQLVFDPTDRERTTAHISRQSSVSATGRPTPPPLSVFPDPLLFAQSLNLMAIALEKSWHRIAANRYLALALDYYLSIHDDYGAIDQMILIGELMVRRRDLRSAARWYHAALERSLKLQWANMGGDKSALLPEHQSTMNARIFDHLGDVVSATDGWALVAVPDTTETPPELSQRFQVGDVDRAIEGFRRLMNAGPIDTRNDEFFYTLATIHYSINDQAFRVFDVYMKKLQVRIERLARAYARLLRHWQILTSRRKVENIKDPIAGLLEWLKSPPNGADGVRHDAVVNDLNKVVYSWCSFWAGAERALHLLIDTRPGVRRIQPLELGRVTDRRRFGLVYNAVGNMLSLATNRSLLRAFYWEAPSETLEVVKKLQEQWKNNNPTHPSMPLEMAVGELDLQLANRRSDVVLGVLLDNSTLGLAAAELKDSRLAHHLCKNEAIGHRSPLWRAGSEEWRPAAKCACPLRSDGDGSQQTCWKSTLFSGHKEWITHANTHITGQLYYLAQCWLDKMEHFRLGNAESKAAVETMMSKLRTIYRAELALLGAQMTLDDNIRDLAAADSSRGLGLLYLRCHAILFELSALVKSVSEGEIEPQLTQFIPVFRRRLTFQFLVFQTAAKRFLANAIDIYNTERTHERCTRQPLGSAYAALGELMLLRAEVFHMSNSRGGHTTDTSVTPIPGTDVQFDGIEELAKLQEPFHSDTEMVDIRRQSEESYRKALRVYLSEIEDYIKRYRFPHSAYVMHQNISDRWMHSEICRSLKRRHWAYVLDDPTLEKKMPTGKDTAQNLYDRVRHVAWQIHESHPGLSDRREWLLQIKDLISRVADLAPTPGYLQIVVKETDQSNKGAQKATVETVEVQWIDELKRAQIERGDNVELRRFYRSFDDGLAEVRQPTTNQPTTGK